jgi:hypothetical protein
LVTGTSATGAGVASVVGAAVGAAFGTAFGTVADTLAGAAADSVRSAGAFGVAGCAGFWAGPAGATGAVACGAADVLAAAFLAVRFFGGFLSNSSANRRTTGASIVEDADRTNSPMSFSLVRTTLLVTPSSFASS